jgi:hypothetical protein
VLRDQSDNESVIASPSDGTVTMSSWHEVGDISAPASLPDASGASLVESPATYDAQQFYPRLYAIFVAK